MRSVVLIALLAACGKHESPPPAPATPPTTTVAAQPDIAVDATEVAPIDPTPTEEAVEPPVGDPAMRGKVALSFTVTESGASVDAKASGFSPALDECIHNQMPGWRFGPFKDGDNEAYELTVSLTYAFTPD